MSFEDCATCGGQKMLVLTQRWADENRQSLPPAWRAELKDAAPLPGLVPCPECAS